jgi:hypothetical protein
MDDVGNAGGVQPASVRNDAAINVVEYTFMASLKPNVQAQAQPPETDLACNDDVQISYPGQN